MNKPTTYEIVLRGRATERLLGSLVDDFVVDHPVPGRTRLTGVIRDPAHLHGVMAHLTSLTVEVISLTPSDPDRIDTSKDQSSNCQINDHQTNDYQSGNYRINERHNQ